MIRMLCLVAEQGNSWEMCTWKWGHFITLVQCTKTNAAPFCITCAIWWSGCYKLVVFFRGYHVTFWSKSDVYNWPCDYSISNHCVVQADLLCTATGCMTIDSSIQLRKFHKKSNYMTPTLNWSAIYSSITVVQLEVHVYKSTLYSCHITTMSNL